MKPPRWVRRIARRLAAPPLVGQVIEIADLPALLGALGWTRPPVIEDDPNDSAPGPENVNNRPRRDREVLAAACANAPGPHLLEIGTGTGASTVVMSVNAPAATIHTVNIAPEDIAAGGTLTTFAPERAVIGSRWRERGCTNVTQILANTAHWTPTLPTIDLAFIDGCHDADFVRHDTRLVLARARPGTLILWHDFHPGLIHRFGWIRSVCEGVEMVADAGLITGPIYHLRDSWVGLYRVPG